MLAAYDIYSLMQVYKHNIYAYLSITYNTYLQPVMRNWFYVVMLYIIKTMYIVVYLLYVV